jgi:hypothetical protein
MDEIQVANDFMRIRRAGINRETKSGNPMFRRQRDETNAGLGGPLFTFVQNRDMSSLGPGAGDDRNEREIGFVPEKKGPTVFTRLFLYAAKRIESNVRLWPNRAFSISVSA